MNNQKPEVISTPPQETGKMNIAIQVTILYHEQYTYLKTTIAPALSRVAP
jgi:hypothetical protein